VIPKRQWPITLANENMLWIANVGDFELMGPVDGK
jgi:hypothetical protein